MDFDIAYNSVDFVGNSELQSLVAKAVIRLPADVQQWLLFDTNHIFVAHGWQKGEFIPLRFHPKEIADGLVCARVIWLDMKLAKEPEEDAIWTVAHEIAHSRLNQSSGGYDAEYQADLLAKEWGFIEPANRASERERYKRSEVT
jgi:hypothetical protein